MTAFTENQVHTALAGRVEVVGTDDPRVPFSDDPGANSIQQSYVGEDNPLLFVVGKSVDPQRVAMAAIKHLPEFFTEIADPALTTLRQVVWRPEISQSATRDELIEIIERAHDHLIRAIYERARASR